MFCRMIYHNTGASYPAFSIVSTLSICCIVSFIQNKPKNFHMKSFPGKSSIGLNWKNDFVVVELLVLSTSLNHWLPGSHVLSLLKHLQVFVTIVLLESTSRQTVVPLSAFDDKCIFESDIISQVEPQSVQIIPSFAGFPTCLACKQKYAPFSEIVLWGV